MLKTMGMTYKQLQRLIIYEGFILFLIAFVSSITLGIILSLLIMFIYCLFMNITFVYFINMLSLFIECGICFIALYIGIILPTLTIYNLPLTQKNGYHIYHSHQRKIVKPTFSSLIINEFKRTKFSSIVLLCLIIFIIIRGYLLVDTIASYMKVYNYYTHKQYYSDFVLNGYDLNINNELDLLDKNKDIHVYKDAVKDIEFYVDNREYDGSIVYCEEDSELMNELSIPKLKDNEVIMINSKMINDEMAISNYQLKIKDVINIDDNFNRLFLNDNVFIVNKTTYEKITNNTILYSYVYINVDNELARSKVSNKISQINNKYHIDGFINTKQEIKKEIQSLNENNIKTIMYTSILIVLFIFIIYIMRILSIQNLKRNIGLLNILGMTKKKICLLYIIQSSLIYLLAIFIIGIIYTLVAQMNTHLIYIFIYIISLYCIYLFSMIFPIRNIMKEQSLNLIK
jgi:hypothetical protein